MDSSGVCITSWESQYFRLLSVAFVVRLDTIWRLLLCYWRFLDNFSYRGPAYKPRAMPNVFLCIYGGEAKESWSFQKREKIIEQEDETYKNMIGALSIVFGILFISPFPGFSLSAYNIYTHTYSIKKQYEKIYVLRIVCWFTPLHTKYFIFVLSVFEILSDSFHYLLTFGFLPTLYISLSLCI